MSGKSGIYKIENRCNSKVYVGSASNLSCRKNHHFTSLRTQKHCNSKLQRAWNKYGEDNFCFVVLEYVEDLSALRLREQHWIDLLDCVTNGYNIQPTAGSPLGTTHTDEWKKNHSATLTGRKMSPEKRAAHIARMQDPEVRKAISEACKAHEKSADHIAKIRESLAKPEVKQKLAKRKSPTTGTKRPEELKSLLSQKAKLRWSDPALREKFVAARRAREKKQS